MTDLEKIAYAKSFLDKLASGIDPTTDALIHEGDVAAKSRVVGCYTYVSEVLAKLINSPATIKDLYRVQGRTVTSDVLSRVVCSQFPVSIQEFARRIDAALGSTDKFTAHDLNPWLMHNGYIEKLIDYRDKSTKRPTQKGIDIGIIVQQTTTTTGRVVSSVRLNLFAQQFIRDHLSEIVAFSQRPPKLADQLPQITFSLTRAQLNAYVPTEMPLSISQVASAISTLNPQSKTGLKAGDLADWLMHLGLLRTVEHGGKNYKLPTDAGKQLGILVEARRGPNGDYYIALYNTDAQRFIIDNIHGLIKVY
jgi:phage antirepressor YoqD-like protein